MLNPAKNSLNPKPYKPKHIEAREPARESDNPSLCMPSDLVAHAAFQDLPPRVWTSSCLSHALSSSGISARITYLDINALSLPDFMCIYRANFSGCIYTHVCTHILTCIIPSP